MPKSPPVAPEVTDYRYDETRKHIPEAGLASHGRVQAVPVSQYSYDPHLPPVLRFDPTGEADKLPELLAEATQRPLTSEEAQQLADALRQHQPWLEWAGKQEKRWFEVDSVPLHVHERVSAQAIIAAARKQPIQPSLFADPELEYREAIKFYEHDIDWSNRLILGDSLTVMHSLAQREDYAGKVQMIYIDPPYGIKFASNFQPLIKNRKVKESAADLTREVEQVRAYRDTWTLGIHSYLTYMRDRLIVARELLTESGSIFVQISEENLHRVRALLDEIFGSENFCSLITFFKTTSQTSKLLASTADYILWYAKDKALVKYHQLYWPKTIESDSAGVYNKIELPDGLRRLMRRKEKLSPHVLLKESRIYRLDNMTSQSGGDTTAFPVQMDGQVLTPGKGYWKTNVEGMQRLIKAERVTPSGSTLAYIRYIDDFPVYPVADYWGDTGTGSFTDPKVYVVQTGSKVIERCLLMTTDPGDLVCDPTCGSGTTAYVSEKWGRRWVTIDTSRVAIGLARQRLLTSKYEFYELRDNNVGVVSGFNYDTVPHVMLGTIAQNQALDPVFDKWDKLLEENLYELNYALAHVTPDQRTKLKTKLVLKEREKGKRNVTEADHRRWLLPQEKWEAWEVPFDSDPDWPESLQQALKEYRQAWRAKMDEVNETIVASAPQEVLVDRPQIVKNILRVSGPFTVESVQPLEQSLDFDSPISGTPEELDTMQLSEPSVTYHINTDTADMGSDPVNASAYLEDMIRLLRLNGVRFPDNKNIPFIRLDPLPNSSTIHAEGEWETGGESRRVAVSVGPQYGPITAVQVEDCLRFAYRRGYDDLVFAGFTIDGAAQAAVQEDQNDPNTPIRCHIAYINPDVNMGGNLLKETPTSQLFTVSGSPRVRLEQNRQGECIVHMEGVDIYDPVKNILIPTQAAKVAAWFLDADYNGRTFNISQAFFPDSKAWDKIAKALKTVVDPARFTAFAGTKSLPFNIGQHKRAAVKVIDPRGNEVMKIVYLTGEVHYG